MSIPSVLKQPVKLRVFEELTFADYAGVLTDLAPGEQTRFANLIKNNYADELLRFFKKRVDDIVDDRARDLIQAKVTNGKISLADLNELLGE